MDWLISARVLHLIGLAIQVSVFYLSDKQNKIPVPRQYEKLYRWLGNDLQKWARESGGEMDPKHPMFKPFITLLSKKFSVKNNITSLYFTNCGFYPIDFHTATVTAFSNGSPQSLDSLSNIVDYMKNEGVISYSCKGWAIFLLGLTFNMIGFYIEWYML